MREIKVKIEWDNPDDENWLNVFNIHLALSSVCRNTKFRVTNLDDASNFCDDGWENRGLCVCGHQRHVKEEKK